MMLLGPYTSFVFSNFWGRLGGLVFHSLEEFSTVNCVPHSQRLGVVNKAKVDAFLELSSFFDDPADVGSLVSGSPAFLNPG